MSNWPGIVVVVVVAVVMVKIWEDKGTRVGRSLRLRSWSRSRELDADAGRREVWGILIG